MQQQRTATKKGSREKLGRGELRSVFAVSKNIRIALSGRKRKTSKMITIITNNSRSRSRSSVALVISDEQQCVFLR